MSGTSDFNDMAQSLGQAAVRDVIKEQLRVVEADMAREQASPAMWRTRFMRNDRNKLLPNLFNIQLILEHDSAWAGKLKYCEFSYRILKSDTLTIAGFEAGEWTDGDTARLRSWLAENYEITVPRSEAIDALVIAAEAHGFHPVREYLEGLAWDGTPRIDWWLRGLLGAEAQGGDPYLSKVGRLFLISAVARIMLRESKVDTVLILEGKQGHGKSTAVKTLFGEWFSDAPIPIGDKDAYQNIAGVWGVEMAELDSFNKAENTAAKLFFSQQRDRYRPSYGTMAKDFPRQCVFVGTTNQDEYLKDYTGNRRYWPVLCKKVDIPKLARYRDQLWAEAVVAFKNGERWWVDGPDELMLFETEQDQRMQADPWENMLADYLDKMQSEYFSADQLLIDCIGLDGGHMQRAHQNRLSPLMKSLGWHSERRRVSVEGVLKQRRVYVRPERTEVF